MFVAVCSHVSTSSSQDTTAFGAWYNFSFDHRAYMNEMHEAVTPENKVTLFEQWAQVGGDFITLIMIHT